MHTKILPKTPLQTVVRVMPMLTANALYFFLSPKLSYVLFILARDHLGKLVFAGDGKISFEICSTQFPTYFFEPSAETRSPADFKYSCTSP